MMNGASTSRWLTSCADKLQAELDDLTGGDYEQRLSELEETQQQAERDLEEQAEELAEVRSTISGLQGQVDLLARQTKGYGAQRDVARANYDLGVRDGVSADRLEFLKGEFGNWQARVDAAAVELEQREADLNAAKAELAQLTTERDRLVESQVRLQSDVSRIQTALAQIDPPKGSVAQFKRWLMKQPIVDGFNSPHGIKQDWLPELKQTLGMANVARFDRCRTCHVTIDEFAPGNLPAFPHGTEEEGKYPHPYASHPNPDLYLTANSPHPLSTFGCTVCHDGDGSGTSFQTAEHTPNNPGQAHHWEDEYHWHSNHFWEYPMQPNRLIESTCIKCHHSVVELGVNAQFGATAPKVYEGFELVKTYGCYGCHEINGYDGNIKIGPDIRLEPGYVAAAQQLVQDPAFTKIEPVPTGDVTGLVRQVTLAVEEIATPLLATADPAVMKQEAEDRLQQIDDTSRTLLSHLPDLAQQVAADPAADETRRALVTLLSNAARLKDQEAQMKLRLPGDEAVLKIPQLDARTLLLGETLQDVEQPGLMRKAGPSLRHIASKTTPEFVAYWTEDPTRFRPDTRMPRFFHLSNQEDPQAERLQPVQIAGIAAYLQEKSQSMDLLAPAEGYQPDAARGRELFAQRGCLACHSEDSESFEGVKANFGPNLTKVHEKIRPGEEGFRWLYTWLREPMSYHARTKMPNLYLEPEGSGEDVVDPAADIAAYLLEGGPREFPAITVPDEALEEMFRIFVEKSLTAADFERMEERAGLSAFCRSDQGG